MFDNLLNLENKIIKFGGQIILNHIILKILICIGLNSSFAIVLSLIVAVALLAFIDGESNNTIKLSSIYCFICGIYNITKANTFFETLILKSIINIILFNFSKIRSIKMIICVAICPFIFQSNNIIQIFILGMLYDKLNGGINKLLYYFLNIYIQDMIK